MKKFITRISIILLLVVALPLSFFLVKQAANLTENEAIVQRVFDAQLETILYSINQNSENIISSWMNSINLPIDAKSRVMEAIASKLFLNNTSVNQIGFFNLETNNFDRVYLQNDSLDLQIEKPDSLLVRKLKSWQKSNYQRIETVRNGDFTNVYLLLNSSDKDYIGSISFNSNTFINQNLGPGIQQISQGRFNISIQDTVQQKFVLYNDTLASDVVDIHRQKMWYIPGYMMQIRLQTATIDELVSERSQRDTYIFIGLVLVVLLGITFVILAIRKEVKLAEMKSEFVSNVSHEIRTPLALISMYAETLLLKRVKSEAKVENYLGVIHQETSRLTSMVNRILSFSKMEKDKRTYQFSALDLNKEVTAIVSNFEPHFKNEGVVCDVDLLRGNSVIMADREALIEAMINLIENAIKYGRGKEKQIAIRLKKSAKNVSIEVEDNGIGISHRHLHHIFDKFYRVTEGNLAHTAKGSGIGLNIVKQIMNKHQGKVEVESKVGEGSRFTLLFPTKKIS